MLWFVGRGYRRCDPRQPVDSGFVGIDLTRESTSDPTTLLKFRRLQEKHNLTHMICDEIDLHLADKCLVMRVLRIVDKKLRNAVKRSASPK